MPKRLDASWKDWLKTNIDRKCDPEQLLTILLRNDFALDDIRENMGAHYPAQSPAAAKAQDKKPDDIDYQAFAKTRITRADCGFPVMRLNTNRVQLYIVDDFMNAQECADISAIIDKNLRPSTVTIPAAGDNYYRTSSTSDLSLIDSPAVKALDEKIARALGIHLGYSEGIQGQRYEVGQEFKQHTDFFAPNSAEFERFGGTRGQRTWTFMVYLNDVEAGGGTRFVKLDHTFMPKKGRALVWNNLHPDGSVNYDTLHAGLPIEKGHKTIITKWFRARGKGPVFYNADLK